jgi:hypothetical protein
MNPRTIRRARALGAALLTWLSGGCAGGAPETLPEPAAAPDPCLLPGGQPGEPRALVVVVTRPEDTAAVARAQPEPMIRLDCTGVARPEVAESWARDSTGRTWTLALAAEAVDVSAGSVAAEWWTRPEAATTLRHGRIASVVPLDQRRLAVTFERSFDSVPPVFADPSPSAVSPATLETRSTRAPTFCSPTTPSCSPTREPEASWWCIRYRGAASTRWWCPRGNAGSRP